MTTNGTTLEPPTNLSDCIYDGTTLEFLDKETSMAIRRIHIPEMTVNATELAAIDTTVETALKQWYNHSTDVERANMAHAVQEVTGGVLRELVRMGRRREVA